MTSWLFFFFFLFYSCNPKVLGESPKMVNAQKWLGEGAKGILSSRSENGLAPVQNGVAPVQNRSRTLGWCKRLLGDYCSLGSKHLLHPLLTTFGHLPFSGSLPELSDCNSTASLGRPLKSTPKSWGYQNQSFSSVLSGPFPPTPFPSFFPPLSSSVGCTQRGSYSAKGRVSAF